jgi:hypothetical protein
MVVAAQQVKRQYLCFYQNGIFEMIRLGHWERKIPFVAKRILFG